MPVDKIVNEAPRTSTEIDMEDMPDVEVILEDDGGATVEIGDDDMEVDFYANLAELVEEDERSRISRELMALFEADKSSREDWEQMYAKGLDLLGMKIEERTKPFRGAAGAAALRRCRRPPSPARRVAGQTGCFPAGRCGRRVLAPGWASLLPHAPPRANKADPARVGSG